MNHCPWSGLVCSEMDLNGQTGVTPPSDTGGLTHIIVLMIIIILMIIIMGV